MLRPGILLICAWFLAPTVLLSQINSLAEIREEMASAQSYVDQEGPYSLAQRKLANLIPCNPDQLPEVVQQDPWLHLEIVRQYLDVVNIMIDQTANPEGKRLSYLSEHCYYEAGIRLSAQLAEKNGPAVQKELMEEAFAIAEYNRNLILLSKTALEGQVAPAQESRLSSLISGINARKSQIRYYTRNRDFAQVPRLEDQRDSLKSIYNMLLDSLIQLGLQAPGFNTLNERVSPDQLTSVLAPHEHFLEFFSGRDSLYVFLFNAKRRMLISLGASKEINQLIQELHQSRHRAKERYAKISYQIYQLIFAPLEKYLDPDPHLIIVPDGPVGSLAFEALHRSPPGGWDRNYQSLDYLLHHYQFSFHHSARYLLRERQEKASSPVKPSVLALAPVFDSEMLSNSAPGPRINPLPHTPDLLQQIDQIFPGQFLYKEAATADAFFRHYATHTILHFSTHALIDEKASMYSKILLAPGAENRNLSSSDLQLKDLYTLSEKPKAQLVVLGSCQSGTGEYLNGESIAGLAYGFRYAGVPGVVYSLWAVDEQATNELLFQFYKELAKGTDKARALHLAKRHFVAQAGPNEADPFYWAGFLYTGPIDHFEAIPSRSWPAWPLWGLGLPLLFLIFFIIRKRRKSAA